MTLVPRVIEGLHEMGLEHIKVFVGGIIPEEDAVTLKELGVAGVFGPGANTEAISEFVQQQLTTG
jgi:methylmalonyl-CoA mutase cobalamin-binding domain/chain